jgi:hypothetical protein
MSAGNRPRAAELARLEVELGIDFEAARMVGLVDWAPGKGWHVVAPVDSISTPLDLSFEEACDGNEE